MSPRERKAERAVCSAKWAGILNSLLFLTFEKLNPKYLLLAQVSLAHPLEDTFSKEE